MERLKLYAGNLLIALGKIAFPKIPQIPAPIAFSKDHKPHELTDTPRTLQGITIDISAALQGPAMTSVPGLHFMDNIPVQIEYYNRNNESFERGFVSICFGLLSFQEQLPGIPKLCVKALNLNMYVTAITIPLKYPFPYSGIL
jgi:hypothetical protein